MTTDSENIFNGGFSIEQAITKLRTRLLDLSSRNGLINYKHPNKGCLRFVNCPNLNAVFERLVESNKSIVLKNVSLPPNDLFTAKRPIAELHAKENLGIDVSTDFPVTCFEPPTGKHWTKIQTLHYPADLEKLCRKIRAQARTVVEETGTNMLYLMFGFLEYYESEDSENPLVAPLLSLPVVLEKDTIDQESRTYNYSISYSGEDIQDNQSLRVKLEQEFLLKLPVFDEEDNPGTYFKKIEKVVQTQRRWKIRYQLTLGFLSFGKLAIWSDLDVKKWPGLVKSPLLRKLFSGGSIEFNGEYGEDYEIDKFPVTSAPTLIYNADSAQHSAIIDVLDGKNRVIIGPPGTGKSQTITNIIGAAINKGLKVLFVSEKLAALEVVRKRLNQANLGSFCLELHSHKTQKKKFLEDIQKCIDEKFPPTPLLGNQLSVLSDYKKQLNAYADFMSSVIGNQLGLTVNQLFWRTERLRQSVNTPITESAFLQESPNWTWNDIEQKRFKLDSLQKLYESVGGYTSDHPWWGFIPNPFLPGDEVKINTIIKEASEYAELLNKAICQYINETGLATEPDLVHFTELREAIVSVPDIPDNFNAVLFCTLYEPNGNLKPHANELVEEAVRLTQKAILLKTETEEFIPPKVSISYDDLDALHKICFPNLKMALLNDSLSNLQNKAAIASDAYETFIGLNNKNDINFYWITPSLLTRLEDLLMRIIETSSIKIENQPLNVIVRGNQNLLSWVEHTSESFEKIKRIANDYQLSFDGTAQSLDSLNNGSALIGLLPQVTVEQQTIDSLQFSLKEIPEELGDITLSDLRVRNTKATELIQRISQAFKDIKAYADDLSFPFNGNTKSLAQLTTVCTIAKEAPFSLLNYRGSYLSNPLFGELLAEAKKLKGTEAYMRESLQQSIYLDALPDINSLKSAFRTLRQTNDSILNIFNSDWKTAVKLVNSISKNKIKGTSVNYQKVLAPILDWYETVNIFHQRNFKDSFGVLYKGLETDTDKLEKLHDWYVQSREKLLKQGNLKSIVDLISIDSETLQEYATLSDDVLKASEEIHTCIKELNHLFFEQYSTVSDNYIDMTIENFQAKNSLITYLTGLLNTYVTDDVSPAKARHLLSAKLAFTKLDTDFLTIREAVERQKIEIEPDLPGISLLPIVDWGLYLDTIKNVQQDIRKLSESLTPYSKTATPKIIHEFLKAKLNLDKAINDLNIQIPVNKSEDWKSFANHFYMPVTNLSNYVVAVSQTINNPSITLKSAIDNLKKRQNADLLLLKIREKFDEVQLGGALYNGYETDLDSITATLSWGNALIKAQKITKSELLPLLFGLDFKNHLYHYKSLLDNIDEYYQLTVTTLQELNKFGNFSWQQWSGSNSTVDHKIFASLLQQKITKALANANLVLQWSQYIYQKRDCEKEGLSWFISGLEEKKFPSSMTETVFQYSVYWSISRIIYSTHPILKEFNGLKHQSLRTEFASLDDQVIKQTGKAFAHHISKNRRIPQGDPGPSPRDKTDLWLLRHEINKTTRHLPIRQLLKRSGAALQALKPCFMMGPLSAAQYLEHGSLEFDLVVMDEASQLRPEEALGVIARGKQLVIVGDPKQLPPTRFFDKIMEEEEEEEGANIFEGSESILDICQQLFHPVRTLRWHYRSQHESLIAFSNHHFYNGGLVFFPSPFNKSNRLGIKFRYLKNGVYENRRNINEATRLVDSVFEHILKYPEESIGIVTLNQTQRDLVDDLLEKKLFNSDAVLKYKEYWEKEEMPLFVKNLENVQGDERDVIFISTTFGKGVNTSKVRQNFGPISRPDGWRRLNVLFTRARRKIELFTSMLPEDIVIDEQTPRGTKALRDYLYFANNNILYSGTPTGREVDSDFELSVKDVLESKGYEVVPQLGVAGYFVDLAVKNPERLGEFMAAIECDGASYHSSKSARDRDRIRQEILESLGWKDRIYRIWSTDWFYNPRHETERLLEFLEKRRMADSVRTDDEDYYHDIQNENKFESFLKEVSEPNIINEADNTPPEVFVGLRDKVTFHYTDKPLTNLVVTLVQEASDPKNHQYNVDTPLGKALLDAKVGDTREVVFNGNKRVIRVRAIEKTS